MPHTTAQRTRTLSWSSAGFAKVRARRRRRALCSFPPSPCALSPPPRCPFPNNRDARSPPDSSRGACQGGRGVRTGTMRRLYSLYSLHPCIPCASLLRPAPHTRSLFRRKWTRIPTRRTRTKAPRPSAPALPRVVAHSQNINGIFQKFQMYFIWQGLLSTKCRLQASNLTKKRRKRPCRPATRRSSGRGWANTAATNGSNKGSFKNEFFLERATRQGAPARHGPRAAATPRGCTPCAAAPSACCGWSCAPG